MRPPFGRLVQKPGETIAHRNGPPVSEPNGIPFFVVDTNGIPPANSVSVDSPASVPRTGGAPLNGDVPPLASSTEISTQQQSGLSDVHSSGPVATAIPPTHIVYSSYAPTPAQPNGESHVFLFALGAERNRVFAVRLARVMVTLQGGTADILILIIEANKQNRGCNTNYVFDSYKVAVLNLSSRHFTFRASEASEDRNFYETNSSDFIRNRICNLI